MVGRGKISDTIRDAADKAGTLVAVALGIAVTALLVAMTALVIAVRSRAAA